MQAKAYCECGEAVDESDEIWDNPDTGETGYECRFCDETVVVQTPPPTAHDEFMERADIAYERSMDR